MGVSVIANLSLSGEYRGRLTFTSTANVAPAKAGAACSMVLGRRRPQLSLGRRKSNRLAGLRPVGEEALDALFGQHMLEQPLDDRRRRGHHVGADLRGFEHIDRKSTRLNSSD